MNMQAILKQAQSMQNEIMKTKKEIDQMEFTGEQQLVKVVLSGDKKVKKVEIDKNTTLDKDDIEMIEDMMVVAFNDALNQIEELTEKKLGKYSKAMSGLM